VISLNSTGKLPQ